MYLLNEKMLVLLIYYRYCEGKFKVRGEDEKNLAKPRIRVSRYAIFHVLMHQTSTKTEKW